MSNSEKEEIGLIEKPPKNSNMADLMIDFLENEIE